MNDAAVVSVGAPVRLAFGDTAFPQRGRRKEVPVRCSSASGEFDLWEREGEEGQREGEAAFGRAFVVLHVCAQVEAERERETERKAWLRIPLCRPAADADENSARHSQSVAAACQALHQAREGQCKRAMLQNVPVVLSHSE